MSKAIFLTAVFLIPIRWNLCSSTKPSWVLLKPRSQKPQRKKGRRKEGLVHHCCKCTEHIFWKIVSTKKKCEHMFWNRKKPHLDASIIPKALSSVTNRCNYCWYSWIWNVLLPGSQTSQSFGRKNKYAKICLYTKFMIFLIEEMLWLHRKKHIFKNSTFNLIF